MNISKNMIAIAALAIIGVAYVAWAVGGVPGNGNATTGDILNKNPNDITPQGTLFQGSITNKNVEPMKLMGIGEYDRNCVSVARGLTNCHGGIKTAKYGVLDFNYVHDMAKEPCIAPGQELVVTILDSSGKATVQRVA